MSNFDSVCVPCHHEMTPILQTTTWQFKLQLEELHYFLLIVFSSLKMYIEAVIQV